MNKVLTVLMSLQLVIAPVAFAQESGAGDQFRNNPDAKAAGMDYMEVIQSITMGAVGVSAAQCTMFARLPSLMVFSAASLVYIATELTAGKGQHNFLKKKAEDIKMLREKMKGSGGQGEVQRATLVAALEDEEEILSIIKKKLDGISMVSKIFKVATALALVEAIGEKLGLFPAVAGCNAGTMSATQLAVGKGVAAVYGLTSMKSSGIVSGAATFGAAYVVSQGMVGGLMNAALNTSIGRAAAFVAATAIYSKSSSKLKDLKDKVEQNIVDLKEVIADFDRNTIANNSSVGDKTAAPGTATAGAAGGANGGDGAAGTIKLPGSSAEGGNFAINPLANVSSDPSKNCWSESSGNLNYSTNCENSLKLSRPNLGPQINVPTLRNATNAAMDYAQGIASGDSAKASAASGTLAAMAGKMDNIQKDLVGQLNKKRKEDNKEPLDLEAEASKFNKSMESAINGALASNGMDVAALSKLNALGADTDEKSLNDEKLDINTASSSVAATIPSGGEKSININEGLSNSEAILTEGDVAASPTLEESLSQYESSESDISNRSDDNLFKQVSMRYKANYDRFFERKKVDPPADQPK